ncbi:GNAT family N-acetyltransferase [uncultured Microscilla sp.]|uniref:GNAT family N-acetyltransferase n=1 Tax=uncultured Microscilla sp. TaxID=432653 RepID=UPI00261C0FDB|nr:GNAT family N-acetyltransferase [uncultured Microscilla sp.]
MRLLQLHELSQLYDLNQSIAQDPATQAFLNPRSEAYLGQFIHTATGFTIGAYDQEQLIGYRAVHYTSQHLEHVPCPLVAPKYYPKTAHFAGVGVAPNYRRQGIAQQMISIALYRLCHQGFRYVTVRVRPIHEQSIDLFTSFGFQIVYLKKDMEPVKECFFLLKELTPDQPKSFIGQAHFHLSVL